MMRRELARLGLLAAILLVAVGFFAPKTVQASTQDFVINSFEADYFLTRNDKKTSQMQVNETIVATFPEFNQNHGIIRAIPKTYLGHTVSLNINSVTSETGRPLKYTRSTQNDNLVLKIGDADTYVHGTNTYKISYQMKNVTSFQSDHEELYWDVNGDQWPQAMGRVVARVHIPKDLQSNLQDRQVCYVGKFGSTGQDCEITRQSSIDEIVITTVANNVESYQTATFVLGFNQGTFVLGPEIAAAKRQHQLIIALLVSSVIVPPILTAGVMYSRWRKFGKDPRGRGVIVAQYEPPKGFNVLSSGFMMEERLPTKAISAAIIELAIQRYLDISEIKTKKLIRTETDYELELIKDYSPLSAEQKRVITAFFGTGAAVGSKVLLSSLKQKLHGDVSAIDTMLGTDLTSRNYFTSVPSKARSKYVGRATVLLILGIIGCLTGVLLTIGIGLIISAVIVFVASSKMPSRSLGGVEVRDHLLGVKEFIKVVEEKRFEYLQSPEGAEKTGIRIDPKNTKQKVKLFEDLLPYAMLFGLEKGWAKQFEDIYPSSPDWYNGDYATFRTAYLISSINNMSTASSQAFSSPASSSSSGFGGGGFSGGGGGGGGGGGW